MKINTRRHQRPKQGKKKACGYIQHNKKKPIITQTANHADPHTMTAKNQTTV